MARNAECLTVVSVILSALCKGNDMIILKVVLRVDVEAGLAGVRVTLQDELS
jgi:hypothetical protein